MRLLTAASGTHLPKENHLQGDEESAAVTGDPCKCTHISHHDTTYCMALLHCIPNHGFVLLVAEGTVSKSGHMRWWSTAIS